VSWINLDELRHERDRYKELYESALEVNRRLQKERDGLLDRVRGALLGIDDSRALPQIRPETCPLCGRLED